MSSERKKLLISNLEFVMSLYSVDGDMDIPRDKLDSLKEFLMEELGAEGQQVTWMNRILEESREDAVRRYEQGQISNTDYKIMMEVTTTDIDVIK